MCERDGSWIITETTLCFSSRSGPGNRHALANSLQAREVNTDNEILKKKKKFCYLGSFQTDINTQFCDNKN